MTSGKIRSVDYSRRFLKSFAKLPARIAELAEEKEKLFRENPFHPLLRTHKLSGRDKDSWAFWIAYSYRVKFIFLSEREVLFLDIGTHEIYR